MSIVMFSWWTEGGERDALRAVLDVHEERHPGVEVINVVGDNADDAREVMDEMMKVGDPPDTFQANIGADLLSWVDNDAYESNLLPIDDLAGEEGWHEVFPEKLLNAASQGGKLYAVPLNVHRVNALFYNKNLFDEFNLKVPETLDELEALVDEIRESDAIQASHPNGVAPLALGNRYDWTLSLLTFEAMLPAVAGADYYERFWTGKADPRDPEFQETLERVLFLNCGAEPESSCDGYFNADSDDITWSEAVDKMGAGSAAMTVMGDWAKGYLESHQLVADEDFGVAPFPGSQGAFVFTADTFSLPDGDNAEATRKLLATFGSKAGQVAFNSQKGSIPARTDLDLGDYPDKFDAMSRRTVDEFRDGQQLIAISGLIPADALPDLGPELKAAMNEADLERVIDYLESDYGALD